MHQSMWKIEPNVNPFSQQATTDNKYYSGQSDPSMSFLLRHATQKGKGSINKYINCIKLSFIYITQTWEPKSPGQYVSLLRSLTAHLQTVAGLIWMKPMTT